MRRRARAAVAAVRRALVLLLPRLRLCLRPGGQTAWDLQEADDVEAAAAGAGAGAALAGPGAQARAQHPVRRAVAMLVLCAAALALAAVLLGFLGPGFVLQLCILGLLVWFVTSGAMQWLYVALVTLPRDVAALLRYLCLVLQARSMQRRDHSIVDNFHARVRKHPNKPCFVFEDETWTFAEVDRYSNKVALAFQKEGYRKGDKVALMMENRPEFVCLWLGLAKLGVVVPLINYNLRQHPLLHCLRVSGARALVFGSELLGAVKDVAGQLPAGLALLRWGPEPHADPSDLGERHLPELLAAAGDGAAPPEVADPPRYRDALLYIYTSGTTGLPKAAVIDHSRFFFIAGAISWMAGFKASDRFYTPLPLYHTAGGVMSVGQALLFGGTVVIRRKFSASAFFPDIRRYECTVAQYIGEMCRYVLAVPAHADDAKHKLRVVFGNGLRPQIWAPFVKRFAIPRVAEFYGATEGNANIVNTDNTEGAIGFVSRILPSFYPISVIRVDAASGEPLRGPDGLCSACAPGEPGVFIGKIVPGNPARAFLGYVDKEASRKKVVHDVFRRGDSAFISGDILVSDKWGYLFFKDRTGDTFRWKGENVSTTELEAVISNLIDYRDCVVYGVQVPGLEGRAGMAAIADPSDTLDVPKLADGLRQALPPYARPQFLRLLRKVDLTGTFKLKKKDLQEEGLDPQRVADKLLYLDGASGRYEALTPDAHARILAGTIRF